MQKKVAASSSEGVAEPTSFLSRASRQGRNYSTVVGWLLYTVFKGRTKTLTSAIILNLVHLASQAGAIYIVYWYARQMEQNGLISVPLLHINLSLKDRPEWLWAVVIASTGCFIISASLLYVSRQLVLNIAEMHFGRSLEQLVLLTRCLPNPRARIASSLLMDYGTGGLSIGCRRGALIATAFAHAITAVIGGIGAAVFLFWIDLPLTVLILLSAALAVVLLYPLMLRAVQSAKNREKAQAAFKIETRKLSEPRSLQQTVASVETAERLAHAYMMRRRVLIELVFAIEIGITIILGLVVFYMANQALAGREQWAVFIAYIGALRMTLSGCSLAVQAFASVSRYYPGIVRYYLFIKDVEKMSSRPLAEVMRGDTVILGTLPNGVEVLTTAGDRLALATCDPMHKLKFALLHAKLRNSTAPVGLRVIDPSSVSITNEALALLDIDQLDDGDKQMRALDDALRDKVTLVTYGTANTVGVLGEKQLLTIADGELHRFVQLGTSESDAALKEIARLAAKKRKKSFFDDDEEEEEEG
jgi:hypothetical protein